LLIEREVIFAEDLEKIFGKRQWTSRQDELMAQNGGADILDTPELGVGVVDENKDKPKEISAAE
jgi:cell division protease FtsH